MSKQMTRILLLLGGLALSACATVLQGEKQSFVVVTSDDQAISKTQCHVKNEEGAWNTVPYKVLNIHRDGNTMEVLCENGSQTGIGQIVPDFNSVYLVLDVLMAGCLACPVDAANNAFYQYPSSVIIPMTPKLEKPQSQ